MTDDPAPRAALLAAARDGMLISYWAHQQPDAPAIICSSGNRTFGELNARANQLARALRRRGVGPGDAVALLCGNRPEFAEVLAATQRIGARFTPVNWHLTGDEAGYVVDDCNAVVLVADARLGGLAVETRCGARRAMISLALGGDIAGWESFSEALASEEAGDLADPCIGTSMLYTSGTTGRPKGVHRPRDAAAAAAQAVVASNPFGYRTGEDVHLCTGPLYHAAPLAFSWTVPSGLGIPVVIMEAWDPETTLRLIAENRVTHTHMVPTMFHRLLALPEKVRAKYDISSLRHVMHGAAPCPVAVKVAFIDWVGPIVVEYYAATEGLGTFVDSETWLRKPGTVGAVTPPDQITIIDESGTPLGANEIGLVYLKAPPSGRFAYYKDESGTSVAYRGDCFTLGDVGYIDDEGYLFLTDRSANLIISGGVNIYPAEVDGVLLAHPSVGDAATIGIPNPEWGEEVLAVVELNAGIEGSPQLAAELIEFCRRRLARFKCPRSVAFTETLPRQDNGKISKRLVRDQYRRQAPSRGERRPATNPAGEAR